MNALAWMAVIGGGLGLGAMFLVLLKAGVILEARRRRVQEHVDAAEPPDGRNGASTVGRITEAECDAVLASLLWEWRRGMPQCSIEGVMHITGLDRDQTKYFMRWARGQVRSPGKNVYRCEMRRGAETWWLWFVQCRAEAGAAAGAAAGSREQGAGARKPAEGEDRA